MRLKSRRWVLAIGLACALACLSLVARAMRDPRAGLTTVSVGRGDVAETVTALGKIQPSRYVDVGAQVSGQLQHIRVQPGDPVQAGQLLVEIDPRLQAARVEADRAQLEQLEANLAEGTAQAEYAAAELARQTQLKRDNATREDVFAAAGRDERSAAARVRAVRAQIRQTRSTLAADEAQLGYTRIYAPMSGTVISVDAREGQTINANYSAPLLLRIADLATLTVWTQVSEADVTRLRPGMPLYFTTLGYGERRWTATLRQILPAPPKPPNAGTSNDNGASPAAAPSGGNNVVLYTALFDIPNSASELRPEMSAQVFFVTASATAVVTVPMAALAPKDLATGLYSVQVASGRHIETRDVRIGVHDRFTAEVLSGLRPGDAVVTGTRSDAGRPPLLGVRL